MHKEYIDLGDTVLLTDSNGMITKREKEENLDEVLKIENRIEQLENKIQTYHVLMNLYQKEGKLTTITEIAGEVTLLAIMGISFITTSLSTLGLIGMIAGIGLWTGLLELTKKELEKQYQGNHYQMKVAQHKIEELKENKKNIRDHLALEGSAKNTVHKIEQNEEETRQIDQELEHAYHYGSMVKKIQKKKKQGNLEEYISKLGCSEEEKEFYFNMIKEEQQEKPEKGKTLIKK